MDSVTPLVRASAVVGFTSEAVCGEHDAVTRTMPKATAMLYLLADMWWLPGEGLPFSGFNSEVDRNNGRNGIRAAAHRGMLAAPLRPSD